MFIDARDIEQGESTALEDRGAAKLKEYQATDSFEFEVITRDYRKKWDLGDITTFYDKALDYLDNNQIVEVQETYEGTVLNRADLWGPGQNHHRRGKIYL